MNRTAYLATLCMLLATPATLAGGETGAAATPAADRTLALAPDDALGVIYCRDVPAVLGNPVLGTLAEGSGVDLARLVEAWSETFGGSLMVAGRAAAMRPDAIGLALATSTPLDRAEVYEQLETRLAPALAACFGGAPVIDVGRNAGLATVRLVQVPLPFVLYVGVNNGMVYADTRLNAVTDFVTSPDARPPGPRFVDSPDFERLANAGGGRLGRSDLFAYLDLRPLLPLLEMRLAMEAPTLYDALGLGGFEWLALAGEWSGDDATAHLAAGITEQPRRLAALLAPVNGRPDALAMLPPDTLVACTGCMTDASAAVDTLCEFLAPLAPEVVDEYRAELAELTQELGFDPQHDLLANFIQEWTFAVRVDSEGEPRPVLALRLADTPLFLSHVRNLVAAYDLPVDTTVHRGVEIFCGADQRPEQARETDRQRSRLAAMLTDAEGGTPPVAFATLDGYLVLSTTPRTIAAIVDHRRDGQTLGRTAAARSVLERLPLPAARLAYVNFARLAELALAESQKQDAPIPPELLAPLRQAVENQVGVGFALRSQHGLLYARATASEPGGAAVCNALAHSVIASLAAAREQSKRVVSAANLRGVMQACHIYANDHQGNFPESLAELVEAGFMTTQMCVSPYDGSGPHSLAEVDDLAYFLYRSNLNIREMKQPADLVVLAERELRNGGANFAFADGHVEWLEGPRAETLLAEFQAALR